VLVKTINSGRSLVAEAIGHIIMSALKKTEKLAWSGTLLSEGLEIAGRYLWGKRFSLLNSCGEECRERKESGRDFVYLLHYILI
jgi:hypothetical protein